MTDLLLLRHALPVSGHADPGLSEVGQAQAERVAQWLTGRHIDAVVTSPLRRARETAAVIEAALKLTAEVVPDLREWELDDPDYVYDAVEDMAADDPRLLAVAEGRYDDFVPQLDTVAFQRRTVSAIESVFARYNHGETVVVSTHGGFISAYLGYVIGSHQVMWFNAEYTGISRVTRMPGGRVVVRSVNETGHLEIPPRAGPDRRLSTDPDVRPQVTGVSDYERGRRLG
ncbi:MAG TPA: histidine phosphatase family protein [Jatrophihabitans sp.]|nr:histidine phosphatase family protein [Jatrophihabitans sp.]